MTLDDITTALQAALKSNDFIGKTSDLVQGWEGDKTSLEAVTAILQFMEAHPDVDYGIPGPLVHFVERYQGPEYQQLLVESVARKPTSHTIWMLNRLINGTDDPPTKQMLLDRLIQVLEHPLSETETLERAIGFIKLQHRKN